MESLIKEGRVTRGWIGVEPRDLTPEIAKTLDLPVKQGVLITGVVQSGPASEGGLRPGDVVAQDRRRAGRQHAAAAQRRRRAEAARDRRPSACSAASDALDVKVTVGQRPPSRPIAAQRRRADARSGRARPTQASPAPRPAPGCAG